MRVAPRRFSDFVRNQGLAGFFAIRGYIPAPASRNSGTKPVTEVSSNQGCAALVEAVIADIDFAEWLEHRPDLFCGVEFDQGPDIDAVRATFDHAKEVAIAEFSELPGSYAIYNVQARAADNYRGT